MSTEDAAMSASLALLSLGLDVLLAFSLSASLALLVRRWKTTPGRLRC